MICADARRVRRDKGFISLDTCQSEADDCDRLRSSWPCGSPTLIGSCDKNRGFSAKLRGAGSQEGVPAGTVQRFNSRPSVGRLQETLAVQNSKVV